MVEQFKTGIEDTGLKVLLSHSAIIPVLIGDAEPALNFAKVLRENGVFTPAVRPPSVPQGMCRIRATLMALHTQEHVNTALKAFRTAYESVR